MRQQLSSLIALVISCLVFVGPISAEWAYEFAVHDGKVYVISNEPVDPQQIGRKIGKVTKYSDREGTYSGNFSNRFPEGTEYYEIIGVGIHEAIAIKDDDSLYIKAAYRGEYAGNRYNWTDFIPYVIAVLVVVLTGYLIIKKKRWFRKGVLR